MNYCSLSVYHICIYLLAICGHSYTSAQDAHKTFVVDTRSAVEHQSSAMQSFEPTRLICGRSHVHPAWSQSISTRVEQLLGLSGQCIVIARVYPALPQKRVLKELASQAPLLIWFSASEQDFGHLEWMLCDTATGTRVAGKRYTGSALTRADVPALLARDIWREVVGEDGPFLSKLAYIKRYQRNGNVVSELCVAYCDGTGERVCLREQGILVAPVWHTDMNYPRLLYSQFTLKNVRLMTTDMHGRIQPVLDVDGTVAGIALSPDGVKAAYCRSGILWQYTYDSERKKGMHRVLVHEDCPVANPCWYHDELVYCCAGSLKAYNTRTGERRTLVRKRYAVGPSVHESRGMLVYAGRTGKHLQLWTLNLCTGIEEQLTRDPYDHIDPAWSPCGNYVVYVIQPTPRTRVLEVMHCATRKRYRIDAAGAEFLYPAWSPAYDL